MCCDGDHGVSVFVQGDAVLGGRFLRPRAAQKRDVVQDVLVSRRQRESCDKGITVPDAADLGACEYWLICTGGGREIRCTGDARYDDTAVRMETETGESVVGPRAAQIC